MLQEKEISKKIRSLQLAVILANVRDQLRRAPHNCKYHHDHKIPNTEETIGLCMYGSDDPENWPGDVCDQDEIAQACPMFSCKTTKQQALKHEAGRLQNPVIVKENYPEIAALLWVLTEDTSWMIMGPEPEQTYLMDLSWWDRMKLKLGI